MLYYVPYYGKKNSVSVARSATKEGGSAEIGVSYAIPCPILWYNTPPKTPLPMPMLYYVPYYGKKKLVWREAPLEKVGVLKSVFYMLYYSI